MAKTKVTPKTTKKFDLSSIQPESGITVSPRSDEQTIEIYNKLDQLEVNQSYKMPIALLAPFQNAKLNLKRIKNKVIIMRRLDSYNFRCWRLADDTKLTTPRSKKKNK